MSLKRSIKSILQLLTANLAVKIVGIASLAFFTRYFSKDELAILPTYEMLKAFSHVMFGCGIQPTVIRTLPGLLSDDRKAAQGFINVTSTIQAISGLIFSIVAVFFAEPLAARLLGSSELAHIVRISSAGFFFFALRNNAHYLLWSASRFDKISLVRIVAAIGRAVLGVGGMLIGGVEGLVWGLVLNDLLALIVAVHACRDMLRPATIKPSALALIRTSMPFYFESYLTYLRNQGDSWIVAATLGPTAMSIYFVAKRFPMMLMMFVESLDKVVTTELSRRRDDLEATRRAIHKLLPPLTTIAVPGIFMVMGLMPVLIRMVAGPGFEAAILPSMVLCLMQLVRVLAVPMSRGVFVTRPPVVRVVITSVESAFLIAALFLLTPILNELGVAVSRFIAALVMLMGGFVALRPHTKIHFPWKRLIISVLMSSVMVAVVAYGVINYDGILHASFFAFAGGIVFLIMSWLFQPEAFFGALDNALPFSLPEKLTRLNRRR